MKKFLKIICNIFISIVLLLSLVMLVSFVNHKIQLKNEDALFKTNGEIVEVNNHNINVYVSGNSNSEITLVFMSGAGTCSPTLDFKSLYSLFESDYQIAVVEKAGYGCTEPKKLDRLERTILW